MDVFVESLDASIERGYPRLALSGCDGGSLTLVLMRRVKRFMARACYRPVDARLN